MSLFSVKLTASKADLCENSRRTDSDSRTFP